MDSAFLFYSGLSGIHVLMPIDLRHQNLCSSLLPSKPAVLPPSFSSRGLFTARDQPARILWIPARCCRSFALQSLRCVSSEEAKGYGKEVSMKALNLWAFMRGFEVYDNRIGTKKPCPLNLWGHGFVVFIAAAVGVKRPAFGTGRSGFRNLRCYRRSDR